MAPAETSRVGWAPSHVVSGPRLSGRPDAAGRLTDLLLAPVAAAPQALDAAGL